MKALRILSLLLIASVMFGCEKDVKEEQKQDVVFGINEIDPTMLKSDLWDIECSNFLPVKAVIEINGIEYEPEVFFVGGKLYTQSIKMAPGNYTVSKFLLLDAESNIIMATPLKDSDYDVYVSNPLSFDFIVEEFKKKEVEIDVLCFEEAYYEPFGFFWFHITEIVVREICFFGDICATGNPFFPSDFEGSLYEDIGDLFVDMKAIFEIRAYKTYMNVRTELPYSPFSNVVLDEFEEFEAFVAPLCVQYPDKIRVQGEYFEFELWILIPDGQGGFIKQLFHTFSATDDGALSTDAGENGVVEFVLGDCNDTPTDLQLSWYD